jgi:hypothetical protein
MDFSKVTANDLKALLGTLSDEELATCIKDIPESLIIEVRKEMNPYGRVIEGSNAVLLFSYTDLREKYLLKLLMTSIIAFLNRACDEWEVPKNVPVVPVYDYVRNPDSFFDPSILTEEQQAALSPEDLKIYKAKEPYQKQYAELLEKNKEFMRKRIVVKEFLEHMFQFDPDRHVRSAYRPNLGDPERQLLQSDAARLAFEHSAQKDTLLRADLNAAKASGLCTGEQPVGVRKDATELIPPADLYGRFNNYFEEHYEELRKVVQDLYCEKADLERAINPHQWYTEESAQAAGFSDTADAASKFIDKHKKEAIAAIYTADSGKWNFFGPFKQVRDRVNFYNENTQILEEMARQIDADSKLGRDLMNKNMAVAKRKNIEADGPDDPAFLKWKKENSALKNMGAVTVEDEECPDDAIQVDVFRISKGGQQVERGKFYTEAEAPKQISMPGGK